MPVFRTRLGRAVRHCHIPVEPCRRQELTPSEIEVIRQQVRIDFPDAVETGAPTWQYNCHGHALAGSHGWFDNERPLVADNYTEVSFASPQEEDVVVYVNEFNGRHLVMHTAVVTRVEDGEITRVRSKWGHGSELSHQLTDLPPIMGRPRMLLRLLPQVNLLSFAIGSEKMTERNVTEEVQEAIATLSEPGVYVQVAYASTPEALRVIIESLPGIEELLAIGPEAGRAALNLLESQETDNELSSIALYLLQRIPTPEAAKVLATAFSHGEFTGLNMHLAADALLTYADVEEVSDDHLTSAFRAAEKLMAEE